jgi:hypothetical protein
MAEAPQDRLYCKLNRDPNTGSKGSLMVYEAVLLRLGEEIKTLYWNGSLQETVNLARRIALNCEADRFRVIECTDSGAEVRLEEVVSLNNRQRSLTSERQHRWCV